MDTARKAVSASEATTADSLHEASVAVLLVGLNVAFAPDITASFHEAADRFREASDAAAAGDMTTAKSRFEQAASAFADAERAAGALAGCS